MKNIESSGKREGYRVHNHHIQRYTNQRQGKTNMPRRKGGGGGTFVVHWWIFPDGLGSFTKAKTVNSFKTRLRTNLFTHNVFLLVHVWWVFDFLTFFTANHGKAHWALVILLWLFLLTLNWAGTREITLHILCTDNGELWIGSNNTKVLRLGWETFVSCIRIWWNLEMTVSFTRQY